METVYDEKIVISPTPEPKSPFEEYIVPRKTIVYETLIDPAVIKIASENIKNQLFAKYGFLKTKPEEVTVTRINKHYEPHIVVSGKYTIDYYRKRVWNIKVNDEVTEVMFGQDKFAPKQITDSFGKTYTGIEFKGEERVKNTVKASITIDASGREFSLKQLHSSPSERNPEEVLAKADANAVPTELDLSILRNRIFKRPADISWIVNETFEVNERLLIYAPRFTVTFQNVKTGKEKTAEFDGVTGKIIQRDSSQTAPSV